MSTIQLGDGFGLNVQAAPNAASAFAKYFNDLPNLSVLKQDLALIQDLPLTEVPLTSTEIGLSFDRPISLGSRGPQLSIGAGVSGALTLFKSGNLFDAGPFGEPVPIPAPFAYMALGVKTTVDSGTNLNSGNFGIGFTAGTTVTLSHYKRFETTATGPTLKSALETSLANYIIPAGPDDLASLSVGDIATIEGTGSLEFAGNVNLLTSVNPLASVSSAVLPGTIQVKEGATFEAGASFAIGGEFQIQIQKLDAGTVRIGIYRKHGVDFTVQAKSSVGISAGMGDLDFISTVFNAINPKPFPSAGEFEQAGLTEEKIIAISAALKAAVQRRLELAVEDELHALSSQESVFLYEVDLGGIGPEGRAALQKALSLNLSGFVQPDGSLPVGIREIHSILTNTRETGQTLKFNVLGIYNYASLNELTLKGSVLTDPASGEIVLTDDAHASHIAAEVNFLADGNKLRKLLAQSFLITAAYRCSKVVAQPPTLKASYWHFDLRAKTDHQTMAADFDLLAAMGLVSGEQEQKSLSGVNDFGQSTFYVNTDYDDPLTESLFLRSDGQPRILEEYEQLGRKALRLLLHEGDDDGFRLRAVEDDATWNQVKATGGTLVNLAPLFPDLSPTFQIPVIAGDFVLIEWWATTMAGMAGCLADAKRYFSQSPPPAPDNPDSKRVQADLWHRMADVASNTHDRFAEPWGLLVMDLASGQQSDARAQIRSPQLTLSLERPGRTKTVRTFASAV